MTLPVVTTGPHAATMGIHFYTGTMFPAEYRNVAFVARKGSWNRTKKFGYDVVTIRTDASGGNARIEPFITGFLDTKDAFWGRPVYMQMPDGSLLLSDEQMEPSTASPMAGKAVRLRPRRGAVPGRPSRAVPAARRTGEAAPVHRLPRPQGIPGPDHAFPRASPGCSSRTSWC